MDDRAIVFKFIDDFYRHSSRRPKMYFGRPESCEEVVSILESLRDKLVGGEHKHQERYTDYLVANGFGSSNYLNRYVEEHPGPVVEDHYYTAYFQWLRSYLETQGRCLTGPEDDFSRSPYDRG